MVVERLQGYAETNFAPGRVLSTSLGVELERMTGLQRELAETARRCVTRVAPDPICASTATTTRSIRACLAGHRVAFRTATEWVAEILALKGDSYRLKDRDLARPAND
jgi:hypothetical protein